MGELFRWVADKEAGRSSVLFMSLIRGGRPALSVGLVVLPLVLQLEV
jgi:hypothetical protein